MRKGNTSSEPEDNSESNTEGMSKDTIISTDRTERLTDDPVNLANVHRSKIRIEQTQSGTNYEEAVVPSVIALPVGGIIKDDFTDDHNYTAYSAYATAETIGTTPLPITQPNARKPDTDSKGMYNDIKDTLEKEPQHMRLYNNGITMITENLIVTERDGQTYIILEFDGDYDGVANGGHTVLACQSVAGSGQIKDVASLRVEIIERQDLDDGAASKSVRTRNEVQSQERRSLIHNEGWFEPLFPHISDKKLVNWYQNSTDHVEDAIKSDELLQLLYALDMLNRQSMYSNSDKGHKPAVDGAREPLRAFRTAAEEWSKAESTDVEGKVVGQVSPPWQHLYGILPFAIPLWEGLGVIMTKVDDSESPEHIRLYVDGKWDTDVPARSLRSKQVWDHVVKNNGSIKTRQCSHPRWRGEQGIILPRMLAMTMLGWLRKNIWLPNDQSTDLVGWRRDPLAMLDAKKVERLKSISDSEDWNKRTRQALRSNKELFSGEKQLPEEIRPREPDILRRREDPINVCYVSLNPFDWAANYPDRPETSNARLLVPHLTDVSDLEPTHALSENDELIQETDPDRDQAAYARVEWFDFEEGNDEP